MDLDGLFIALQENIFNNKDISYELRIKGCRKALVHVNVARA